MSANPLCPGCDNLACRRHGCQASPVNRREAPMDLPKPTPGRIVLVEIGKDEYGAREFPAIVVRTWPDSTMIDCTIFLPGAHQLAGTSVPHVDAPCGGPMRWRWPPRA